ncbi:transposase, partial [Aquibacillus koreensis]|nr:transposase [Aquibacillus koreensis]
MFSNRYKKKKQKLKDLHRKAAESRKYAHNEDVNKLRVLGDHCLVENMNIKGLQRKAKGVTKNKNGKYNRRKRYGRSISKRSPGYFIKQAKYRFESTGGKFDEVNTWTFKASQYDHMLNDTTEKQLSIRWHKLPNGIKVQRDLYSAFLLYCANDDLKTPNYDQCIKFFNEFLTLHEKCINGIKDN